MARKIFILFLFMGLFISGCGAQVTTATEPKFKPVSDEKATPADASVYAALEAMPAAPADRITLAIAIEGVDPATLHPAPNAPVKAYQVGDVRQFWVHNSSTLEVKQITAKLVYISKHAYFWQDEATIPFNASAAAATEADWEAAGQSFDQTYERVRAVFGQEESPGLDGDPRLFIINSDALGTEGGHFGQADQLPVEIEPFSNQGQYFYMSNSGSAGIASDYYKEVLAHEFQHMIHKNVDPDEEGWFNEGMSMLSQQVAGMRGDNWVEKFFLIPDQSLWYWSSESSDYGQSYLFMDYLYEQMGEEFIKDLVANQANGLESVDETLSAYNSPRNADMMYADSYIAAFFNNPGLAEGQYAYQFPALPEFKPKYEFPSLPAVYEGTVQQYGGVDVMTFTGKGKVTLQFSGDQSTRLIPSDAHSGENFWWSARNDSSFTTLTRSVDLTGVSSATLKYWAWYSIEEDWDYAYLLVSTDEGQHWTLVPTTSSRETNPNQQNLGHGISGISGSGNEPTWVEETADLSAFAGQKIQIRFAMQNDLVVNEFGFAVDDLSIPELGWVDDVEADDSGWTSGGFIRIHNRVPQVWSVRVVEQRSDGSIVVHSLEVQNGAGKLAVNFEGLERLVVFVFGQTRHTTIPAAYRITVQP